MNRLATAPALIALALTLGTPGSSPAAFLTGTQGIADIGSPTIDTSSLGTATKFFLDDLVTTRSETGDFANPRSVGLSLGSAVLDINNVASFILGTDEFSYFRDVTSIVSLVDDPSVRSYQLTGTFTPGTRYGSASPISASFTVSFTQTSGAGQAISDSGTLSVPAVAVVPTPTSGTLLGLGLVGFAGVAARRRRAA